MPALSFSLPWKRDKVASGECRQTIRPARKHPIKVGDKLYLYWHQRQKDCRPLLVNGESVVTCTESFQVTWADMRFDGYLSALDGFGSKAAFYDWFSEQYHPKPDTLFSIIRW